MVQSTDRCTLITGIERATYGALFANSPALRAEVPTRMRVGELVIDEERVRGLNLPGLPPLLEYYEKSVRISSRSPI
jgi:hypothetical protein